MERPFDTGAYQSAFHPGVQKGAGILSVSFRKTEDLAAVRHKGPGFPIGLLQERPRGKAPCTAGEQGPMRSSMG